MIPRLLEKYKREIVPELTKIFKYRNSLRAPRIKKIVINMGVGQGSQDIKVLEQAMQELALITGQKAIITRAKKSIANFKIKKGVPVGCKVTLRGYRCYEFLDRFVNAALPRIKDFRGVPPDSFDKNGNYSLGINEQIIFPEIEYDKVQRIQGVDITFVTSAKTNIEAYELLRLFGMPFQSTAKKSIARENGKTVLNTKTAKDAEV